MIDSLTSCEDIKNMADVLKIEVNKNIVGLEDLIDSLTISVLVGGHVLIEGFPGTGKTFLASLFGQSIAAGESLFVHVNNDATGSSEINLSSLGGTFASPFDTGGAFGLNLYFDPLLTESVLERFRCIHIPTTHC